MLCWTLGLAIGYCLWCDGCYLVGVDCLCCWLWFGFDCC